MKELILVRHAKSSWDNNLLTDFERPLNDRGLRDAPVMAQVLANRGDVHPDLLITSPSIRTLETAQAFIQKFNIDNSIVQSETKLYNGTPNTLAQVIRNINDKYNQVILFAHNTALTDFINEQTNVHIDNLPTCGVFAIKVDTDNWSHFSKSNKKFWFFEYPKLHT